MAACDRMYQLLTKFLAGDVRSDELEETMQEFLCAYGEARSDGLYDWRILSAQKNDRSAIELARLVQTGKVSYPMCVGGAPMVPGSIYFRPDGSKSILTKIEIGCTCDRTMLIFADGQRMSSDKSFADARLRYRRSSE